ncbi:hypothetical protein BDF14DRAFT_1831285 [Spinellus fusiger]|nr:hypothetical protein BDF14DRAFT_1831285 [Spinellus fusiger]
MVSLFIVLHFPPIRSFISINYLFLLLVITYTFLHRTVYFSMPNESPFKIFFFSPLQD